MKEYGMTKRYVYRKIVMLCLTVAMVFATVPGHAGDVNTGPLKPAMITEDMRCPVCGMFPAHYPKWHSQVIFTDGSMEAFDGCKDMFTFLLDMQRYDEDHDTEDVAAVFVKDFMSGEWINARDAYFVAGSGMAGPMGKEIVPFENRQDAMRFHGEHGGSMAGYGDISMQTVRSLKPDGMKMDRQAHGKQHTHH